MNTAPVNGFDPYAAGAEKSPAATAGVGPSPAPEQAVTNGRSL